MMKNLIDAGFKKKGCAVGLEPFKLAPKREMTMTGYVQKEKVLLFYGASFGYALTRSRNVVAITFDSGVSR
jgi:hypothetical protein